MSAPPGAASRAEKGRLSAPLFQARPDEALLQLDGGAGLLELALDAVGLFLAHALLAGLGSPVDEVLGLLEAEAGDGADDLDHLDLLAACRGEDDVERRLLLGRLGGSRRACRR